MKINAVLDEINRDRNLGSSNQCYDVMYTIARTFQVEKVVEIGTHKGGSSITFCQAILDNKKIPKIYSVDSWIQADMKVVAQSNFQKAGFDWYINMIQGDSKVEIPKLFEKIGKVDLIFIDGDHSDEAIIADYNNCKNFSNLIMFHDSSLAESFYFKKFKEDGWNILNFPTRYIEGDGHLVGIALAYRS